MFCEYSNDYAVLTNVFEAMKQGMETRQDKHCQLNIQGFIGDVMHMARLVDSCMCCIFFSFVHFASNRTRDILVVVLIFDCIFFVHSFGFLRFRRFAFSLH